MANKVKVKTRNVYVYACATVIIILINRISIVASCVCLIQRNENNECSEAITLKNLGIPHKHSLLEVIQHHFELLINDQREHKLFSMYLFLYL